VAATQGKAGSSFVLFLWNGYNLLAHKVKSQSFKRAANQEATHGLGDDEEEKTPTGLVVATLTQAGGFFDTTANQGHAVLQGGIASGPQATPGVAVLGFSGNTIGEPCVILSGTWDTGYHVGPDNGQLTKADAEYAVTGEVDAHAVLLQNLVAKSADWNTKTLADPVNSAAVPGLRAIPITSNSQANPSVVTTPVPHGLATGQVVVISGVATSSPTINGTRTVTVTGTHTFTVPVNVTVAGTGGSFVPANSLDGGIGVLQVNACSGFTNFVGKIQDSAVDVTYAALITFADNVAAPFAEAVEVAGTVDQYLSVDGNVTGVGSISALVAFARR
jgi:hypothetical protein